MATSADNTALVSSALIHRLEPLSLRARLVVEGTLAGLHRSPYHGFSVEFAEHRMYQPGDPLRHIDWKVLGRTDRYYIKQYEEETNLRASILLDASGSMDFVSGGQASKFEYGRSLAAALIHLLISQRDAVGMALFDTEPREVFSPRSAMPWRDELWGALARAKPGGETSLAEVLHTLAERTPRRGFTVLISDLLDEPEALVSGLHHLRHRGHEVVVFQLLDPRELDFAFDREARFEALEQGGTLTADPWQVRSAYREEMARFLETLEAGCARHKVRRHLVSTDTPLDKALLAFLTERAVMP